jgi:hypothetical protein
MTIDKDHIVYEPNNNQLQPELEESGANMMTRLTEKTGRRKKEATATDELIEIV